MLSRPSSSRSLLMQWVKEALDLMTYESADRRYLDEITATEVVDLAYIDGVELPEAIAAYSLAPTLGADAGPITSSMSVSFPLKIHNPDWRYELKFRAARPSLVAIFQGGQIRVNLNPRPPALLLTPRIRGDKYQIQEAGGNRLRILSGPVEPVEFTFVGDPNQSAETYEFHLEQQTDIYAYFDDENNLIVQQDDDGLLPLSSPPAQIKTLSLRLVRNSFRLRLTSQLIRHRSDSARLELSVQLLNDDREQIRNRDRILGSLVLPHLKIILSGATPLFPAQQYKETKQKFLLLPQDEKRRYANARLYNVRQSGCIATKSPSVDNIVILTPFGVFDTPREVPVPGPLLAELISDVDSFLIHFEASSEATRSFVNEHWFIIKHIFASAGKAFGLERLYKFQWDAIVKGIQIEANEEHKVVTIVRAPTGAGKTIVFMINAAISAICGTHRSTSMLIFPTRILNEDMFRRLTGFICQMRQYMPDLSITGGLFIGTSDPLYKMLLDPEEGEIMYQYGTCPVCRDSYLNASTNANQRTVPKCSKCGHIVDYMFSSREVATFLPDIVIATPDKLFHESTVQEFEAYRYGLFGAIVRRCEKCGRYHAETTFHLQPHKTHCKDVFKDSKCDGKFSREGLSKPIRYIGFDEVHSLYGQTATYLSVFLATLEAMQRVLQSDRNFNIRYETATATIANERELLEAITRRNATDNEVVAIPPDETMNDYFTIDNEAIRHRVVITMPTHDTSSRSTMVRALLNIHRHLSEENPMFKENLRHLAVDSNSWDFLMGYVFKIQDGYDFRRSLIDQYQNISNNQLQVEFLSGKSPKDQISRIIENAQTSKIDILLANLVVSLGIDISGLNHMVMFGVPRSFTEYVQTAGRTGRGTVSGHVNIILLPIYPRDNYLYRHFHAVFSDVVGYYDALPVKSTNLYCSEQVFGNVIHGLFASLALRQSVWLNRRGFEEVIGSEKREKGLLGGIAKILSNDAELQADTERLVIRRYRKLKVDMLGRSEFLGSLLKSQGQLLFGLRGNSNRNVRVACMDEDFLSLISNMEQQGGEEEDHD